MQLRNVGQSGLRVAKVGLGCNNFGQSLDAPKSKRVIDAAIDAGVTFFDTSDVYGNRGGSEECIGQALGERRQRVVLGTKFSMVMDNEGLTGGGSRSYVLRAVEASLRRLKTDWIDLYQIHFPDPRTPIEETLRALDDLVTQGKVRYIGSSNFPAWQIADAAWVSRTTGRTAFVSAQNEYSLLFRGIEQEILPAVRRFGLGFFPYFPLASGLLTGKYRAGSPPPPGSRFTTSPLGGRHKVYTDFDKIERLRAYASDHQRTLLELAMSWLAAQPGVSSVIAGATRPEQVVSNAAAADWELDASQLAEIDKLLA
jgi:aryl-alcohol dehydrogenase-like predicted oxidoreductase